MDAVEWHLLLAPLQPPPPDLALETAAACPAAPPTVRVHRAVFPDADARADLYAYVEGLPAHDMVVVMDRPGMLWRGTLDTVAAQYRHLSAGPPRVILASRDRPAEVAAVMAALGLHVTDPRYPGPGRVGRWPWCLCYVGTAEAVRAAWKRLATFAGTPGQPQAPATAYDEVMAWHRWLTVLPTSSLRWTHVDVDGQMWSVEDRQPQAPDPTGPLLTVFPLVDTIPDTEATSGLLHMVVPCLLALGVAVVFLRWCRPPEFTTRPFTGEEWEDLSSTPNWGYIPLVDE